METSGITDGSLNGTVHADSIAHAASEAEKITLTASLVVQEFNAYYFESRHIPDLAKEAFENRDHQKSIQLSRRRLLVYSESIHNLGAQLKDSYPALTQDEALWDEVEKDYLSMIRQRYSADLAFAYIHSARRMVYRGEWKPVEYSFIETDIDRSEKVYHAFSGGERMSVETAIEILGIPGFVTHWCDLDEDAGLVTQSVNETLVDHYHGCGIARIEMITAGFYRNRGAYLVGRIVLDSRANVPFIVALLNRHDGIFVDAVLTSEADTHNIFSSTLANFHVTNKYYHELSAFLHSIMPKRPLGLLYSAIGFNHVGKVAVMNELRDEFATTNEVLETAIGFTGTVAIGFSAPSSAYNLKVIRDRPTAQYKWGEFEGIEAVLKKYGRVHEINRTGSMLDNIIYYNLKLDKQWFDPALLDELVENASQSVSLQENAVIFKYLIVQRRMTPLPVFLQNAAPADTEKAITNLGYCIKNNAAANIFNKDLDARNYGVSRFLKVYLYDYDALEPFTEVKIRSNQGRVDGEEDIPEWYFENGVVFLPEEIEAGLRIPNRPLRKLFREVHGDLLTVEYWEGIQNKLLAGKVPSVSVYPDSQKLNRARVQ
ncbi:MAG: isocitrate dehydrogenase kinase/phosphatase AceK regulatory subunit [Gammaproteobacteria bacterium]